MKGRLTGIFLMQLFWAQETLSQTSRSDPSDKQARYGATLSLNLPKKWDLDFEYQARYRNDFQDFRGHYLSLTPQKEIFKNFSVLAEYRIALLDAATYHRSTFGVVYKRKIHNTKLGLRGLIQNQVEELDDIDKEDRHDIYWRVKLSAAQPLLKKFEVHASIEPVMMDGGIHPINNFRTTVGVKYKLVKRLNLDVYHLNKQDYAKTYDRRFDIFGIGLEYSWKL